jgi:RHS repeat-associated protein
VLSLLALAAHAQERVDAIYEVAFPRVIDSATLADGIRVEVDCTGLGWLDVTDEVTITRAVRDPKSIELTASEGWLADCAYRLRATSHLRDETGVEFEPVVVLLTRRAEQVAPNPPGAAQAASAAESAQEVLQPNAPGAMVLDMSLPLDPATFAEGIIVERFSPGTGWARVPDEELVIGRKPDAPATDPSIAVMPRSGWERGTNYRIRLTSALKDRFGRSFREPETIAWSVPAATTDDPEPPVLYSKTTPRDFDSARASADTVDGRFPGGQNILFQGAWTDPVTGFAYHRNRWYDPRNATWLSEDPLHDIDSPNLYAFVGWQPHAAVDPLGLFQDEFHQGMTTYLARVAGFTPSQTVALGAQAVRPDKDQRAPVRLHELTTNEKLPLTQREQAARQFLTHFPLDETMQGRLELNVTPGSDEAHAIVNEGIRSGSLSVFGQGLHTLQDSFSHQGEPAEHMRDAQGDVIGAWGHPDARGGKLSTKADHPHEYPSDTLDAILATYSAMVQYRTATEGLDQKAIIELWDRYNTAVPELIEWVSLDPEKRQQWMQEQGISVKKAQTAVEYAPQIVKDRIKNK